MRPFTRALKSYQWPWPPKRIILLATINTQWLLKKGWRPEIIYPIFMEHWLAWFYVGESSCCEILRVIATSFSEGNLTFLIGALSFVLSILIIVCIVISCNFSYTGQIFICTFWVSCVSGSMENELCVGKLWTCLSVGHTFHIVFSGFSCHCQFFQKHCGAVWSPGWVCGGLSCSTALKILLSFFLKVRSTTPGRILIDGVHSHLEMAMKRLCLVCSEEWWSMMASVIDSSARWHRRTSPM